MLPTKHEMQKLGTDKSWRDYLNKPISAERKSYINDLRDITASEIQYITKGKSLMIGWSGGGKESEIIVDILNYIDADYTPLFVRGQHEFPDVTKYINENLPSNAIVRVVEKFSFEFLEEHPGFLFVNDPKTNQEWMRPKWDIQKQESKNFDMFVTGRRIKDGNFVGSRKNGYVNGKTYNPLAEWKDEDILDYIKLFGTMLSPVYDYPDGWMHGSVMRWTEWDLFGDKTINDMWDEIYDIDKSVIYDAAPYFTPAREYLEGINEN